ncbi:MAG TPA: M1 family metallopeptidase [Terriglobales bacterium]|jgi:aminopeptidase N
MGKFALLVLAVFAVGLAPATAQTTSPGKPLSERVVGYQIDARFDAQKFVLKGSETLTYRNLTGQPLDTFPFHLYLNAFQPTSTFMREVRRDSSDFEWKDKYAASIKIESLEVVGIGDLTSQMRFIAPDDGNPDDRTVFEVKLPHTIPPGESVEFKIAFVDYFGEVFARTGYKRDFIMGAQWFPKAGVWWHGKWNCHQFHSSTEFFADFGTFDVRLTLPQNEIVGASGEELSSVNNADGTKTLTFHGEDIHDFAWTAQPGYRVVEDSFTGSMGAVKIRMLMQPGHMNSAPRYMQALKGTMDLFDRWYGPYPYKQITVVDPPHGGDRAAGMEYPQLFTAETAWYVPKGLRLPEDVVEHEFAHQYWYGMVATNEFEEAWLDEGINSYTEGKIMTKLYGPHAFADLAGGTIGMHDLERYQYRGAADKDPMAKAAYNYMSFGSYGDITYGKTATVLTTLEKIVGEETMQRALRTYFERYRFKHPTGEDFLKTVEEVSGQNLRWYYDQAVFGTKVLDYEISRVRSDRVDWYQKNSAKEEKGKTVYRSEVLAHRKGDFIFPVDVLIKFDDGGQVREHWDGQDRWVRYTYQKKAKVISAEVDPEHAVWLDKDFFNNSYAQEDIGKGARSKLMTYWLFFTQLLAQCLAWLV